MSCIGALSLSKRDPMPFDKLRAVSDDGLRAHD